MTTYYPYELNRACAASQVSRKKTMIFFVELISDLSAPKIVFQGRDADRIDITYMLDHIFIQLSGS